MLVARRRDGCQPRLAPRLQAVHLARRCLVLAVPDKLGPAIRAQRGLVEVAARPKAARLLQRCIRREAPRAVCCRVRRAVRATRRRRARQVGAGQARAEVGTLFWHEAVLGCHELGAVGARHLANTEQRARLQVRLVQVRRRPAALDAHVGIYGAVNHVRLSRVCVDHLEHARVLVVGALHPAAACRSAAARHVAAAAAARHAQARRGRRRRRHLVLGGVSLLRAVQREDLLGVEGARDAHAALSAVLLHVAKPAAGDLEARPKVVAAHARHAATVRRQRHVHRHGRCLLRVLAPAVTGGVG
eukprot:364594-Chlamydomonas_euryale.AAC.4